MLTSWIKFHTMLHLFHFWLSSSWSKKKVIFIITWDPSFKHHHSWSDTSIINYIPSIPCRPLSSQNPPAGWTNSNKCLSPANKPPYWSLLMFLLNQSPSPNGHFPHHISFQWETDVSETLRREKGLKQGDFIKAKVPSPPSRQHC